MELPFSDDVGKWTWKTILSLPTQESQYLEYKRTLYPRSSSQAEKNEWRRTVEQEFTAFANASGGILVFGVNDEGKPRPFEPPEHELKQSITQFYQNIRPLPEVEISEPIEAPSDDERYILPVRIKEAPRKPVMTSDSAIYMRVNDRKEPMGYEQIETLFIEHDRRQQAVRQLEMEVDQFYDTYHSRGNEFSTRNPSPPDYHMLNVQSLKEVLRENTHLYSDEEKREAISKVFTDLRNIEHDEVFFRRSMSGVYQIHEESKEKYFKTKRRDLNRKLDSLERSLKELAEAANLNVKLLDEED